MSAVRLWREDRPADCRPAWHNDGAPPWGEYIALPAAEHAALVALLGEARNTIFALRKTCNPYYIALDPGCIENRIDAALAGLEGGVE